MLPRNVGIISIKIICVEKVNLGPWMERCETTTPSSGLCGSLFHVRSFIFLAMITIKAIASSIDDTPMVGVSSFLSLRWISMTSL